jgi:hypothetical protein
MVIVPWGWFRVLPMLKLAFCRGPLLTLMPFQKNLKVAVMAGDEWWNLSAPMSIL